jgi:hypothetical protein
MVQSSGFHWKLATCNLFLIEAHYKFGKPRLVLSLGTRDAVLRGRDRVGVDS